MDVDEDTTLSAGNHALALAYHGAELGIPVTVLMPSIAPLTKITKCRALGARVILEGDSIADAALAAKQYVENDGMKYINGGDGDGDGAGVDITTHTQRARLFTQRHVVFAQLKA